VIATTRQCRGSHARSIERPPSCWLNIRRKCFVLPSNVIFRVSFSGRQGRSGPRRASPCNEIQNHAYNPAKISNSGNKGETLLARCMARQ
jgi:hypothetical protein